MNGFMAALLRSDRPGTADIIPVGDERIILSFSERVADWMARRKVEHVETHPGDAWKQILYIAECSMASGLGRGRSWEQFIPGRETGLLTVHDHDQIFFETACESKVREALHK